MNRPRMAVIGVGHLGKEHARILASLPEVELVGVVDVNGEQARAVAARCQTMAYTDAWPLLDRVDAAVIAVPTCYHVAAATPFLERGVSLLIEKPLAPTLADAEKLVQLANAQDAILQVGHVERFNPAFVDLLRRPFQPRYVTGERQGGFTGRSLDVGVVLDLMIHDIDLLLALTQSPVLSVEALGVSVLGQHEDMANARLTFANGCVANLTASRVSPAPARHMHLFGPEGYAHVDFAKRQLRLLQPHPSLRERRIDLRSAATLASLKDELHGRYVQTLQLDLNSGDQLTTELKHFIDCVRTRTQPLANGTAGREAIAVATRILERIRNHPWNGTSLGPIGPLSIPEPLGALFHEVQDAAA